MLSRTDGGGGTGNASASGALGFDHDNATTSQASLSTVIGALETSLVDLDGFVNYVLGQWQGTESEVYKAVHTEWSKGATTVQDILKGCHTALGTVDKAIQEMRENARKAMQKH
ncbi:MAG: WXG100 family type VII secretion target [Nakamurella sp.]